MKTSTMDTLGVGAHKTGVVAGSITALFSFVSHEMLFSIMGLLFTLASFFVSWYYKRKANARADAAERRREAEHQLRMSLMREKGHLLINPESQITQTGGDDE